MSDANLTMVVDRRIDDGMIAMIGYKQQEEEEEEDEEDEAGKKGQEVKRQKTVELPRPSEFSQEAITRIIRAGIPSRDMKPLKAGVHNTAYWTHCKPTQSMKKIPWIRGLTAASNM